MRVYITHLSGSVLHMVRIDEFRAVSTSSTRVGQQYSASGNKSAIVEVLRE